MGCYGDKDVFEFGGVVGDYCFYVLVILLIGDYFFHFPKRKIMCTNILKSLFIINLPLLKCTLMQLKHSLFDYTSHLFRERRNSINSLRNYKLMQIIVFFVRVEFRLICYAKQSFPRFSETSIRIYGRDFLLRYDSKNLFSCLQDTMQIV